jgi:hypothetical protein
MIKLIFITLFILLIIIFTYFKIKYQFWSIQPVFHIYDLHFWLFPNQIVNPSLPKINKFVKLTDVETFNIKNCPSKLLTNACLFIKENYLRSKYAEYLPNEDDIISYLQTINNQSFLSIYWDNPITKNEIIATITARPMYITFNNNNKTKNFTVNYIDNLTVKKSLRKNGYAPRLIQTHHYHIRHLNLQNNICLFKREGEMTAIIPLTTFTTSGYVVNDILNIKNDIKKNKIYSTIKIGKSNFSLFKTSFKEAVAKFNLQVTIEITTLLTLIIENKIIIYCSIFENEIHSFYIYRNTPSIIDKKYKCMEFICSINNSCYKNDFFYGFLSSLQRLYNKYNIHRIFIEETSDNHIITSYLNKFKIYPLTTSPTAFFLYNYATYATPSKECIFLY